MPFASENQKKWMYANEPEMAERWSKHTSKVRDLPDKVGKMSDRAYSHALKNSKEGPERELLQDARRIGKMVVVDTDALIHKAMKNGPLKVISPCDDPKAKLPMIGKADENFDAMPWAVRKMISQLPLEMQATELGGAGSTDWRPTMAAMNYEMPSRHAGTCGGCDHADMIREALVCGVLQGAPPVAPSAHCDLWTGSNHISKARNGAGPTTPWGEQSMPDYQFIYKMQPDAKTKRDQQKAIDNRRRANGERNNGRFGFHGEPPSPQLAFNRNQYPEVIIKKRPEKLQTKPVVQAPVITHKPEKTERRGLRMFRMRMHGKATHLKNHRLHVLHGKEADKRPNADDSQDSEAASSLMWFPDKQGADIYCEQHPGLVPMPIDFAMAKKYGVAASGYLVLNAGAA